MPTDRSVRSLSRRSICRQLWTDCCCDDDERFPDFVTDDAGAEGAEGAEAEAEAEPDADTEIGDWTGLEAMACD